MPATVWAVPGRVLDVIDGDTVRLELDLGWRIYRRDPCRLAGIDTPERSDPIPWKAAKDALAVLLPVGLTVRFESHELDKYGRPVGLVRLADGDTANAAMLRNGHAKPYPALKPEPVKEVPHGQT